MKWKIKPKYLPPRIGSTRVRFKFAWWPMRPGNGYAYWLRWMLVTEEYQSVKDIALSGRYFESKWVIIKIWSPKESEWNLFND
jgi:hypothetical protein